MIGYVTIGTNDLARARAFYDAVLSLLGAKLLYATETMVAWGTSMDGPTLMVTLPYDGATATVGNGGMVALSGKNRATVDAVHAKALELEHVTRGHPDHGAPAAFMPATFATSTETS